MSVQVDQSMTSKMVQATVRPQTRVSLTGLINRLDFDTMYGVGVVAIIWGGFIAAFWQM